jgi:hypothetical protein
MKFWESLDLHSEVTAPAYAATSSSAIGTIRITSSFAMIRVAHGTNYAVMAGACIVNKMMGIFGYIA